MTTIATDGTTMACDGRGCVGDIIVSDKGAKIYRLGDGSLLGLSGAAFAGDQFADWLDNGARKDEFPKDIGEYRVLHLLVDGMVRYYSEHSARAWRPAELPIAIGSGGELATGAMLAGASPAEAVEIASLRDPFTGGEIFEEQLHVS